MITIILGTRPEIIKLAPIIEECDRSSLNYEVIHTGQHYSEKLDKVLFDQLSIPSPDYNLEVGSGSHGEQTASMLTGIEKIIETSNPDHIIVHGDTNSTLSGALCASKMEPILCHIEAGLRSHDRSMPEEVNRVLVDHVADFLFAPTQPAKKHLLSEGIAEDRVFVTGNTVVDALLKYREMAKMSNSILNKINPATGFFLLTVHRAENVRNSDKLSNILRAVAEASRKHDVKCVYPAHPRAKRRIEDKNISVPKRICITEPLSYLDFICLQDNADLVFTDSGGVQEESCILKTPCVTLRDNTERPETLKVGSNQVVGTGTDSIIKGCNEMIDKNTDWENPFGDGNAAHRIIQVLENEY
jgi:UDP-N-acetylglucosamine 2-epimerase (non-hydrolysing)